MRKLFGVALLLVLVACGQPDAARQVAGGGLGVQDFSFESFDGELFRLSDHRGTPVVLNFWESW